MDSQDQNVASQQVEVVGPPKVETMEGLPKGEVKPITFWPDPSLKDVSDDVPLDVWKDDDQRAILHQLIADLVTTMYSTGGVGLSAPQVGIGARVFVCDPVANVKPQPGQPVPQNNLLIAINPEIEVANSEKLRIQEGCLSFPGVLEAIERPATVRFRARDKNGEMYALLASGTLGRILQHECDHLDGILMLERMGELARSYARKKMRKFRKAVMRDQVRLRPNT